MGKQDKQYTFLPVIVLKSGSTTYSTSNIVDHSVLDRLDVGEYQMLLTGPERQELQESFKTTWQDVRSINHGATWSEGFEEEIRKRMVTKMDEEVHSPSETCHLVTVLEPLIAVPGKGKGKAEKEQGGEFQIWDSDYLKKDGGLKPFTWNWQSPDTLRPWDAVTYQEALRHMDSVHSTVSSTLSACCVRKLKNIYRSSCSPALLFKRPTESFEPTEPVGHTIGTGWGNDSPPRPDWSPISTFTPERLTPAESTVCSPEPKVSCWRWILGADNNR